VREATDADRAAVPRAIVATTNDNVPALYFYQRRGYRLTELVPEASYARHTRNRPALPGSPCATRSDWKSGVGSVQNVILQLLCARKADIVAFLALTVE
jgi:hypothetical protein